MAVVQFHFSPEVPIFDAHVCVGSARSSIGPVADREVLLAELDRHGVARALIYHAHAEQFSPLRGNELLGEWSGGDNRLVPLWCAVPTDDSLAQLQKLEREGQVRAVRLVRAQGLPLADWTHGALFQWLSDVGLPLWIALSDVDARDLVCTIRDYPRLRLVIAGAHYSDTLLAGKIMHALPSASLEISRFEALGAINDFVERFGADRLLYGSWYPRYAMGPVLYYIHHCGLPRELLTQICAGTLERLLSRPGEQ